MRIRNPRTGTVVQTSESGTQKLKESGWVDADEPAKPTRQQDTSTSDDGGGNAEPDEPKPKRRSSRR